MDEKLLRKLLKYKTEPDWLDFKRKLKLYNAEGKLANEQDRDELIKDILGLANGNTHIIRKTKYLIIGADDGEFTEDGMRVLHDVDYKVPTQSQVNQWVNDACTPAVVGIECDFKEIAGKKLYIITIPPTFELHEIIRDLKAQRHHSRHTVFMRKGEHTEAASVRDGIAIQQLKLLHRQETLNPPTIVFGALMSAVIALAFWDMGYRTPQLEQYPPLVRIMFQIFVVILGGFLGGYAGWAYREFKTIQYDWRYLSIRQKILMGLASVLVLLIITFILWPRS